MSRVTLLFQSSIGTKLVMAVSGLLLFLFVIAHVSGNLLVFLGPEAANAYAQSLKDLGGLLWVARIGLLVVFIIHIASAVRLWRINKIARPNDYSELESMATSISAKSMILSGSLVLVFVIYHLLHFTLHITNPELGSLVDSQGRFDVYKMIVIGFSDVTVSIVYIVAMILLGLHLNHGISSLFQTLGIANYAENTALKKVGSLLAFLISVGFISIPLSVIAGLLKLP
jgi:succinate dehydrogenase / fumarate reductase cytochrome b subunit